MSSEGEDKMKNRNFFILRIGVGMWYVEFFVSIFGFSTWFFFGEKENDKDKTPTI